MVVKSLLNLIDQLKLEIATMKTLDTYTYYSDKKARRNQIFLPQNLISFLEEGEKIVHYAEHKKTITKTHFAILSAGNCLMTEKLPVHNSYRSTMLFFDNAALNEFFIKYGSMVNKISSRTIKTKRPLLVFEKDDFIQSYVDSLKIIQSKPLDFSQKLLQLKFEELMLHLLEKYTDEMLSFQAEKQEEYADFQIRKAVELNITNNLTLQELAFLCNTSISTFKRKFIKLYNTTPSQFFLRQRLKMAQTLLVHNENPSEVYYKVGYESHSSFSQAFKQAFGITPKQYQQQNLDVSRQFLND
jgi:AraC-like DNA-binding protein